LSNGVRPTTKYALIVPVRTPVGASAASASRRSCSNPAHASPQNSRDEYDVELRRPSCCWMPPSQVFVQGMSPGEWETTVTSDDVDIVVIDGCWPPRGQ
jgi:hypothetical protein